MFFFKIFINLCMCLFSAVLGLGCSSGFSLVAETWGCSPVAMAGFSLCWLCMLQSMGFRGHRLW